MLCRFGALSVQMRKISQQTQVAGDQDTFNGNTEVKPDGVDTTTTSMCGLLFLFLSIVWVQ